MKLLVFGNSGSGKSTFARAAAARHGLAHLDLDSIVWEPGKVAVERPRGEVLRSLGEFLDANERWVIEGCYGELVEVAAARCTELYFLDPGLEVCLANNLRRPWEPHKYASKAAQDEMLAALQSWVTSYYTRDDAWSHRAHVRIFEAHSGAKHHWRGSPPSP